MNVTSPYGRIPGLRDRHYNDWSNPQKELAKCALKRSKELLKHTRVVDIIGTGDASLIPIARALTGVRVLRVRPDPFDKQLYTSPIPAPKKMVVFGDVGAPPLVVVQRTVVPAGVEKLVINVRYHPAQHSEARFPIVVDQFPPTVPVVVVQFVEPKWMNVLPPWERDQLQQRRWDSIASSVAGMLVRTRRPEFSVTIVGFQDLYPGWVGHQYPSSLLEPQLLRSIEESLRRQLRANSAQREEGEQADTEPAAEVADADPSAWPFPDVRTALRRVMFATREQYAATLDREEHQLETAEVLESDTRNPPLREKWPTGGIMGFIGM